jgi:caa(3)-type oxidase subunit IV
MSQPVQSPSFPLAATRARDAADDDALNLAVYVMLLLLTAATLAAGQFKGGGRLLGVSVALIIASFKAGLIAFYFMGLRRERLLVWGVVATGIAAVLILLAGIYPDMTFARL